MKILLLIILCCWSFNVRAEAPTIVNVSVGKVSEVLFPENIAKVIKGGAVDSVLVEVIDKSLYVLPKSTTPADVFVTGVSGHSYPLTLKISLEHDLKVDVVETNGVSYKSSAGVKVMDLMKDVLLGNIPAGATVNDIDKDIDLKDAPIQLNVTQTYDFPLLTIFLITAKNLSNRLVVLPTQQITFAHLLAIASDADTLNPRGQEGDSTKLYLITAKQDENLYR